MFPGSRPSGALPDQVRGGIARGYSRDGPAPSHAARRDDERTRGDEGAVLDAITDEEAEAAARRDPDNPPLTDEAWEAGLRREAERDRYGVARLRRRLRISQVAFAERYRIPLSTLRQWEQGVREPDGAARLLLRVIEAHPDLVAAVAAREAA